MAQKDTAVIRSTALYHHSARQLKEKQAGDLYYTHYFRPDGQLERKENTPNYATFPFEIVEFDSLGNKVLSYRIDTAGIRNSIASYTYTTQGQLDSVFILDPGAPPRLIYHHLYKRGKLVGRVDAHNNREIKYEFDKKGDVKAEVQYDLKGNRQGTLCRYSFNEGLDCYQQINQWPDGRVYSKFYYKDKDYKKPLEKVYYQDKKIVQRTTYHYNGRDKVKRSIFTSHTDHRHLRYTYLYSYNKQGHVQEILSTREVLAQPKNKEVWSLGPAGEVLKKERYNQTGKKYCEEIYNYNPQGQLTKFAQFTTKKVLAQEKTYQYDAKGRLFTYLERGYGVGSDGRIVGYMDTLRREEYRYDARDSLSRTLRIGNIRPFPVFDWEEGGITDNSMPIGSRAWQLLSGSTVKMEKMLIEKRGDSLYEEILYQAVEGLPLLHRKVWSLAGEPHRIIELDSSGGLWVDWYSPKQSIPLKTIQELYRYEGVDTLKKSAFSITNGYLSPGPVAFFHLGKKIKEWPTGDPLHEITYSYNARDRLVSTHNKQINYQSSVHYLYDSKGRLSEESHFDNMGQNNFKKRFNYSGKNTCILTTLVPPSTTKMEYRYRYYDE